MGDGITTFYVLWHVRLSFVQVIQLYSLVLLVSDAKLIDAPAEWHDCILWLCFVVQLHHASIETTDAMSTLWVTVVVSRASTIFATVAADAVRVSAP